MHYHYGTKLRILRWTFIHVWTLEETCTRKVPVASDLLIAATINDHNWGNVFYTMSYECWRTFSLVQTEHHVIWINYYKTIYLRYHRNLRNEYLFFWVHGGMNKSAGQKYRLNRQSAISLFRITIHFLWSKKKKDTYSLYLQNLRLRPYLIFSEKRYKLKVITPSLLALACFGTFGSTFPTFEPTLFGEGSLMRVQYPKCAHGPYFQFNMIENDVYILVEDSFLVFPY